MKQTGENEIIDIRTRDIVSRETVVGIATSY
jgi:hypothetical protein